MATNKKTQTPAAPATEKKANLDNQMMTASVPARETNENLITTKPVAGKERWFIKKQIASFSPDPKAEGHYIITATRREFRYRGMEEMAQPVAE